MTPPLSGQGELAGGRGGTAEPYGEGAGLGADDVQYTPQDCPRSPGADTYFLCTRILIGKDCWVFDDRVVRFNFQRGDDSNPHKYAFASDPRLARDLAGAFELAWNRATPHSEFKPE
jgi:hypothetical protein